MLETDIGDEEIHALYKRIGHNVKQARLAKGMTQLQLSQFIGHKSVGYVAKAELYKYGKHFSIEQLYKISKVLDVSLTSLIEG